MSTKQWLTELASYILALLFLFTAASKLLDFHHFIKEIDNQPFDNRLTPLLAFSLPAIELLTTVLLVWPRMKPWGLYTATALMAVFTIYVGLVTFHFYDRVPCACAGVFQKMSWPQHLAFNVCFTAIAITGIILHNQEQKLQKPG